MKAMKAPEPREASAAAWALGRLLDVNPAAMPDEAQVWLGWVGMVGMFCYHYLFLVLLFGYKGCKLNKQKGLETCFCDSVQQCHYMRFTHSMRTPSTSSNISLKVTSSKESNMDIAETTEIKCQTLARAGKQNHPSSIISGIVVCNFWNQVLYIVCFDYDKNYCMYRKTST